MIESIGRILGVALVYSFLALLVKNGFDFNVLLSGSLSCILSFLIWSKDADGIVPTKSKRV
jgi:hypothetical protein